MSLNFIGERVGDGLQEDCESLTSSFSSFTSIDRISAVITGASKSCWDLRMISGIGFLLGDLIFCENVLVSRFMTLRSF